MSTVGLELTKFINPELTWKTVSKGSRSGPRRSRKPVGGSLKAGAKLAGKSSKMVEETSVSESEKLGVAVLGRRFGDKVEHVPIKKRRFMFRSPSPPPRTPSPLSEKYEQLADGQSTSGQQSRPNLIAQQQAIVADSTSVKKLCHGDDDGKVPKETDKKSDYCDDFVGIEILATAACNNSMNDDYGNTKEVPVVEDFSAQEGNDSSNSITAIPLKATIEFLATSKELAHGEKMEGESSHNNSEAVQQDIPPNKDEGTLKMSVASRDDRLHWDLNTVMDAWDQTMEDQIVNSPKNVLEGNSNQVIRRVKLETSEGCKVRREGNSNDVMRSVKLETSEGCKIQREGNSNDVMHRVKLESSEGCEIQRDLGYSQHGTKSLAQPMVGRGVTGDVHKDPHMPFGLRRNDIGIVGSNEDDQKIKTCSSLQGTAVTDNSLKESTFTVADANASAQAVSMDICSGNTPSACLRSDQLTKSWISDKRESAEPVNGTINHGSVDCGSGIQLGLAICSVSVKAEKHDVAFPDVSVSGKTACGTDSTTFDEEGGKDSGNTPGVHGNCETKISSGEICTETCQSLVPDSLLVKNFSSISDEVVVPHSSIESLDLSASNASVGEGQHTISMEAKRQDDKASIDNVPTVDPPVRVESKQLVDKSHGATAVLDAQGGLTSHEVNKSYGDDSASRSGKIDLEDPLDDSYDSDVSQDSQGHIVGMDNETKLQEGYDSQYEDGELRESDVYRWHENENENENEDGEAEHVDYESDNGGTYDFDAADYSISVSGKIEAGPVCEKQSFSGSDQYGCESDQKIMAKGVRDTTCQHHLGGSLATDATEAELGKRGSMMASKIQLRKQSIEWNGSEQVEMNVKVDNGVSESDDVIQNNKHSVGEEALKESSLSVSSKTKSSGWDQLPDGSGNSADMTAEIDEDKTALPRASRRELLPRIDLPSSSDGVDKKGAQLMQRSRSSNLDDSYPHFERMTGSDKSVRRGRSPLHMHDRIQGGGRWVDHSADDWNSKRQHSYRYCGPFDPENPGPKSVIVNSKGVYRRMIRRSPTDRDAAYGMHTGMAPGRDIGTNGRGRSGRYQQGFGRGTRAPRNGYPEPMADDSESSVRVPYHLTRRERTFSPIHGRGAPHFSQPRRKSRSRSRTRSPPMWLLEKERPVGLRRFSRSPDFRPEVRMDRVRLPFQKPSFPAEYDADFISPPRNRFSPPHNSRWVDDRDCAVDQFRDRRSPVRMFRQSQRFDSVGVPGRLKSDNNFRPMIRSGRFAEMAGGGRGRRFEGSDDDRRKYGDRYDILPVRHYERDGILRQIRYDAEIAGGAGRGRRYEGSECGDDDRRKFGDRDEVHPVRHFERDGVMRRIRYDAENDFVAHGPPEKDDCAGNTDRRLRDIPRKVREEKGHVRFNHDRMYDSGPKSFGMREYDEDASPGRGRPS